MADRPRLTWFPFYWQDFLGSHTVQEMSLEERGAYLMLLLYQWDKGSISADSNSWEAIMACKNRESSPVQVVAKILSLCFKKRRGCWVNLKLAKIRTERLSTYQALSRAGRKGGEAKARLHGDPSQAVAGLKPGSSKKIRLDRLEKIRLDAASPPSDVSQVSSQTTDEKLAIGFQPLHDLIAELVSGQTMPALKSRVPVAPNDVLPTTEPTTEERERAQLLAAQARLLRDKG